MKGIARDKNRAGCAGLCIKKIMAITLLALLALAAGGRKARAAGQANPVENSVGEYMFDTEEVVIEIPGIMREYTLAWVSDLHMITDHKASADVLDADLGAIEARYGFFATKDGVHGDELLPKIVDYLNRGNYDGVIFGGDILDYCSESNMALLKSELGRLDKKIPAMYIRADHDYGFWYGGNSFTEADAENMHKGMADGDDLKNKYIDFGEFAILGVNNSTKNMTSGQYDILNGMFANAGSSKKPVIVATHVPYASRIDGENEVSLLDKSMEVRGKPYYWGSDSYVPDGVTGAFLGKIYGDDTRVNTVLAGHLHAGWDGKLTGRVRQHIFKPAYLGNIGIIRIVPATPRPLPQPGETSVTIPMGDILAEQLGVNEEHKPNPENDYKSLRLPAQITRQGDYYFIVDTYNDQVLYAPDMWLPIDKWRVMDRKLDKPHAVASDGKVYLVADTDNNRVLGYEYVNGRFQNTQRFENVGTRPHYIQYDATTESFFVWSSVTGDMYIMKRLCGYNYLYIKEIRHIYELEGFYVRSFGIIGDEIIFPSGDNQYMIIADKETLGVKARYPVTPEISGMAFAKKIGGYYYMTVSTDESLSHEDARMIRTPDLSSLQYGLYENLTGNFKDMRVPYYIDEMNGSYYVTNHEGRKFVYKFNVADDMVTGVQSVH